MEKINKPIISIVAAIGVNRELGRDNKLLWQIPDDMKRFRKLTQGHAVIMGRKTYESIGKPLPKRINIVITKKKNLFYKSHPELSPAKRDKFGMTVVSNSLENSIDKAKEFEKNEIFIIGGGQVYNQGISLADRLYLTVVEGRFEADTFFPDYSIFKKVVYQEKGQSGGYKFTFLVLIKD